MQMSLESMVEERPSHKERLPPRGLTLLYLGFAYLCLGLAFLGLALLPGTLGGFFYHSKMLAVVHLVTLGWISSSILGALYLIGPIALRSAMPAGKADYVAWALVVIGVAGMVTHFWIDEYNGMVWSGGTLLAGTAFVGARILMAVRAARIPGAVKLHITLAVLNILAAGLLGLLIGFEKQQIHVLPGYLLHTVYAHAHLAALGWATMMVMGTAYRLFPMVLPAAAPKGPRTWMSAVLLEAGLIGLVISLPFAVPTRDGPDSSPAASALLLGDGSVWSLLLRGSTLLIVAALVVFFSEVIWMKRHPKPSPKGLARPDFATFHAMQAVFYLAVSAALGSALALTPPGAWKIRAAMAYGVFSLLGFLAQMVIGIAARILPTFAWMHFYVRAGFEVEPPSQYTMHWRGVQLLGFALWTAGVPALAYGLTFDAYGLVSLAGWVLLAGLACNAVNGVAIVRHAFAVPSAATEAALAPGQNR